MHKRSWWTVFRDMAFGRSRPSPTPPPHRIWWSASEDCWVFGGEGYQPGYTLIQLTEGHVQASLPADVVELMTEASWDELNGFGLGGDRVLAAKGQ